MTCLEKNQLLADYQTNVRLYALAVDQLQQARSTASRATFAELKVMVDENRERSEFSRHQLEPRIHARLLLGARGFNGGEAPWPVRA